MPSPGAPSPVGGGHRGCWFLLLGKKKPRKSSPGARLLYHLAAQVRSLAVVVSSPRGITKQKSRCWGLVPVRRLWREIHLHTHSGCWQNPAQNLAGLLGATWSPPSSRQRQTNSLPSSPISESLELHSLPSTQENALLQGHLCLARGDPVKTAQMYQIHSEERAPGPWPCLPMPLG